MSNQTDPFAETVHGSNPQYLIEKITRLKIYNCIYWKESCFGLTAETIIDKAIELKYYGGLYGGSVQPTKFLCLVLKLLQLQPEKEIILEFIRNEDFKYLRVLGAFYLRLTCKAEEIYRYLEPLYNDYRKLSYRSLNGWTVKCMDEYIDNLLTEELVCDISLPHIPKRMKLEDLGLLKQRESVLDMELEALEQEEYDDMNKKNHQIEKLREHIAVDVEDIDEFSRNLVESVSKEVAITHHDSHIQHHDKSIDKSRSESYHDHDRTSTKEFSREKDYHHDDADRKRDDHRRDYSRRRDDHRRSGGDRDRNNDDRRHHRNNDHDRRREDSRDRYRDRDRHRDDNQSRDRGRDRVRDRHDHADSRRDDNRVSSRDDRDDTHTRRYRSRSPRRRRSDSRDRHHSHQRRSSSYDRRHRKRSTSKSSYSSHSRSNSRSSSSSRGSDSPRSDRSSSRVYEEKHVEETMLSPHTHESLQLSDQEKKKQAAASAAKRFDKIFGKKSAASNTAPEPKVIAAPEGSVEYWNQMRASLGIKKLKE